MTSSRDAESIGGTNSLLPGPAIIVAGRYSTEDAAQDNINQTATAAYNLFQAKGRTDSEIYLLAADDALAGDQSIITHHCGQNSLCSSDSCLVQ